MAQSSEGLGPAELTAMSAYELGSELNTLEREIAAFTDAAVLATRKQAEAEVTVLYDAANIDAKAQVTIQRAALSAAKLRLQQLKGRKSAIQSLLRTIGTQPGDYDEDSIVLRALQRCGVDAHTLADGLHAIRRAFSK